MSFQLGWKPHQTGRETKQNQVGGLTSLERRGHEDRPRNIVLCRKEHDVVNPIFIGRRQIWRMIWLSTVSENDEHSSPIYNLICCSDSQVTRTEELEIIGERLIMNFQQSRSD
jgi:hypothetical protein